MTSRQIAEFRRRLLGWYDRHRRDLPWRRTRDPYAVLLSEFMLQQTQVTTAIPYYDRFLARFPDLAALARAREQEVLRAWAGLGYYRRARQLHQLALAVKQRHDGALPRDYDGLGALPGVGPYTAAAVASIAFGEPRACVDGNVVRVVARLFCETGDVTEAPGRRRIEERAHRLLAPRRPGDFNQAMMELGAVICRPRNPACATCPVRARCCAQQRRQTDRFPHRPARRPAVLVAEWGAAVFRRGRVLLLQRAPDDRWAGLWEIAHAPTRYGETPGAGVRRVAREQTGLHVRDVGVSATVRYTFTHHRISLRWAACRCDRGRVRLGRHQAFRWARPGDLEPFPMPAPHRRIAACLQQGSWP